MRRLNAAPRSRRRRHSTRRPAYFLGSPSCWTPAAGGFAPAGDAAGLAGAPEVGLTSAPDGVPDPAVFALSIPSFPTVAGLIRPVTLRPFFFSKSRTAARLF